MKRGRRGLRVRIIYTETNIGAVNRDVPAIEGKALHYEVCIGGT